MSIEKQLAINRLKLKNVLLPLDVLNIIKSYAFEDIIVALIKKKKVEINKLIKRGRYLRFNNYESWDKQIGTLIFMGDNCSICGNYIDKTGIANYHSNSKCHCSRNIYYEINDNDIYNDDYYTVEYIGDVWSNYG